MSWSQAAELAFTEKTCKTLPMNRPDSMSSTTVPFRETVFSGVNQSQEEQLSPYLEKSDGLDWNVETPVDERDHIPPGTKLSNDEKWEAIVRRDFRYASAFVYYTKKSNFKLYCRPVCKARRPRRKDVIFFDSPAEAERQGYRPCLRCRPHEDYMTPDECIAEAVKIIDANNGDVQLKDLSRRFGRSKWHFHRCFKRVVGLTPKAYARRQENMSKKRGRTFGNQRSWSTDCNSWSNTGSIPSISGPVVKLEVPGPSFRPAQYGDVGGVEATREAPAYSSIDAGVASRIQDCRREAFSTPWSMSQGYVLPGPVPYGLRQSKLGSSPTTVSGADGPITPPTDTLDYSVPYVAYNERLPADYYFASATGSAPWMAPSPLGAPPGPMPLPHVPKTAGNGGLASQCGPQQGCDLYQVELYKQRK